MNVIIVSVEIGGEEYTFTSEPMTDAWADILLREFILQRAPFVVKRAKKIASSRLPSHDR
jgi:hypothetical protein